MTIFLTYFVHGTTVDNERKVATGWENGELSEQGRAQCLALTDLVSERHFVQVYSSDLRRAVQSARFMFPDSPLVEDLRLRECHYGELTGALLSQVRDSMVEHIEHPFRGGESYLDVERRVRSFLDDLKENCRGRHVALVSHQAPQLALEVILNGKTWEEAIAHDWRRTGTWQPGWEYTIPC